LFIIAVLIVSYVGLLLVAGIHIMEVGVEEMTEVEDIGLQTGFQI